MRRFVLFTTAFILAAPAAAQDTPQAPAPSQPPAAQPSPRPAAEVGQMVQAEFPARDRDGNGALNQAEFSAWVGELLARAPGQGASPPSPADVQTRATAAFTRADTDRDQAVSPTEMTALFSRTP